MTAQVTGRIEYPHRADYEDQVVLPVDDKGLVIQSFAKDSKEGKRYFKTEFYSTAMKLISTDSILIDKGMYFYSDVVESGVLLYCFAPEGWFVYDRCFQSCNT